MTSPPPKPIKPGQVKVVRALYNYQAQANDELSFEEGDLLYIFDMISSNDWWKARTNGREGLVPSNYVSHQAESISNPLHDASKRGNIEYMKECLQNGVSANGLDQAGCTPLHWAAMAGNIECAEMLLNRNAKMDIKNKMGETALHSAASRNQLKMIEFLLSRGANSNILNNDKQLPYQLTRDTECAALLKSRGTSSSVDNEMYLDDEEESD